VRVPPLPEAPAEPPQPAPRPAPAADEAEALAGSVLWHDEHVIVLNKPPGLAVQGGTRQARHLGALLGALRFGRDEDPRLVHRLDKDTSGLLVLARTGRAVKAVLLDQSVIAGVGNIYADEALFAARIAPDRPGRLLSAGEARALARAVRAVLTATVEAGGTTLRDYVDGLGRAGGFRGHAVYGRAGEPCGRCGRTLERRVIAQRGTVACPNCQGWHASAECGG